MIRPPHRRLIVWLMLFCQVFAGTFAHIAMASAVAAPAPSAEHCADHAEGMSRAEGGAGHSMEAMPAGHHSESGGISHSHHCNACGAGGCACANASGPAVAATIAVAGLSRAPLTVSLIAPAPSARPTPVLRPPIA